MPGADELKLFPISRSDFYSLMYVNVCVSVCVSVSCRQQSEEGDRNGSEEEDEEKPGKRVMGPRKKFVWDDKLR